MGACGTKSNASLASEPTRASKKKSGVDRDLIESYLAEKPYLRAPADWEPQKKKSGTDQALVESYLMEKPYLRAPTDWDSKQVSKQTASTADSSEGAAEEEMVSPLGDLQSKTWDRKVSKDSVSTSASSDGLASPPVSRPDVIDQATWEKMNPSAQKAAHMRMSDIICSRDSDSAIYLTF
jgi:hypothetical protein